MLRNHMFRYVLHAEEPKNKSLIKIIKTRKENGQNAPDGIGTNLSVPVLSQHPY